MVRRISKCRPRIVRDFDVIVPGRARKIGRIKPQVAREKPHIHPHERGAVTIGPTLGGCRHGMGGFMEQTP